MKMIITRYILTALLVPILLFLSSGIAFTDAYDPEKLLWFSVREENIQFVKKALKDGATGSNSAHKKHLMI
ncbi:MAG: hypothetical protein V8K32_08850 [Candidatus Electrothrix gigas]